ncbi:MAG: efflux transporter outer membrane subunit, partial [Phycisphaerae bacterium]|nr:efflux transporter outer membrane subunit [Phycisphaerae bacterium]
MLARVSRIVPVCSVAALSLASGCMVGPDYTTPQVAMPEKFDRPLPKGVNPDVPPTERWWLAFHDPLLEEFIGRAELQNLNLKSAVSTLEQYRAQYDISFAQLFPDIDASAGYSRVKVNSNSVGATGADVAPFNRWSYGMEMASWEIDLWGKLRRQVQGALGRYEATAEEYRAALVSVRADVAQAYIAVRTLQAQRANAIDLAAALERVVKITEAQVRYQTANKIDLAEAKARRSASLAEVSRLEGQLASQIAGLSLLLGEMPGEVRKQVERTQPIPMPQGEVAVGIPAELLLRRPDVRAAERTLAAFTADVGASVANFLPELSLSGAIGVDAGSFSGLGNVSGNLTYFFGPSLRWDFFRIVKGQTQAEVNVAKARMNSALLAYQLSVLTAMKQVDAALANYSSSRGVRDSFADAFREVDGAYALAMRKYEMGTIDLTQLIQFLEILIQSRDGLAQGQGLVAQNLIELYRSLGGGWET